MSGCGRVRVVGWPGLATGNFAEPFDSRAQHFHQLSRRTRTVWLFLLDGVNCAQYRGPERDHSLFSEREIGGTDAPEQSGGVSPEESHTTKRPQAMRRPLLKAARCARRPNGCDVGPWPPARASFGGCLSAAFFLSRPYTVTFFLLVGFATRHCAAGIYQRQPGIESDHLPRQLLRLDAACVPFRCLLFT